MKTPIKIPADLPDAAITALVDTREQLPLDLPLLSQEHLPNSQGKLHFLC
jgi:hypothetical protein